MRKYLITTFGCQANIADSEKTVEILENIGCRKAKDTEDLLSAKEPVLIFNTCSVRQKAEDRVFGLNKKIQDLKIKNLKLKVILTGCMMHYSEEELKERLPFFDYFIDIKKIDTLSKLLAKKVTAKMRSQESGHILDSVSNQDLSPQKTSGTKISALVPISNGCDNFCTYCIVPLARGREISRPAKEILADVKKEVDSGAKEIWLLGQTVNSYSGKFKPDEASEFLNPRRGRPTESAGLGLRDFKNPVCESGFANFADLLRLVNSIPGEFWIRFTSPHPKDFSDDLIKAMTECEKFAHYINLPVQSGNNAVLKRMGRPYTADHYKKLVKKIRKAMPGIAISTDVIVGFPGETRKQFEDTKKLFEEIKFDMAFISEYSPRPKTTAAKMFKDDVPHAEKEERKNEINEVLKKTVLENNKKLVGKIVKVLNGRTEGNKPIELDEKYDKNNFVSTKITKANIWSLKGKLL